MQIKTDCVIIGGGICGLSAAYYLSKQNMKVLLVDRCDSLTSHLKASCVNCGIMCGPAHAAPGLSSELFGRSLKVAELMGESAKYVRSGCIEVLMNEKECQWARQVVKFQTE